MSRTPQDWFSVDKEGLARLLARRGKAFAVFELVANAWDTDAKVVRVALAPVPGRRLYRLEVEDDDPEGFSSLEHAWVLFAESERKADASKRGRFGLGEKLVLALCQEAEIRSTRGVVLFDARGRTASKATQRPKGSVFAGTLRMTREEAAEVLAATRTLIPPEGVATTVNGVLLPQRPAVRSWEATLPTEVAREDGTLRRSTRKTLVSVHEVLPGETATLYELGIPVVETGDRWHVCVHQKVPLTSDRDNVTPAYLREVRTSVLNAMHDRLAGAEEATAPWVREAASDPRAAAAAVDAVITQRFGEKRVIADPTDPEGTKLAVSLGYSVIQGGALSKGEWANVRGSRAALPAGRVTPSPRAYDPKGDPMMTIHPDQCSEGMRRMAGFAMVLADRLLGADIGVVIGDDLNQRALATYGPRRQGRGGTLMLNSARLGRDWFDRPRRDPTVLGLLVHEFGHHTASDHLSAAYHDALCTLGAKLAVLALTDPDTFEG